jgi:hypothetical protein
LPQPKRLRGGWLVARDGPRLVLARRWPPRLDLEAAASFPPCARLRLAQQIRQDLWRRLQRLRGFSPVVEVTRTETGLTVRAGGRAIAPVPPVVSDQIAALLTDPALRARWIRSAAIRKRS